MGADEGRLGVSEFDFGAEDIEFRDGTGIETMLGVFKLALEEFDGFFSDGDDLLVEKNLVEVAADGEDCVGNDALEGEDGDLVGEFGGANGGVDAAAGVNELGNFDLGEPGVLKVVGRF